MRDNPYKCFNPIYINELTSDWIGSHKSYGMIRVCEEEVRYKTPSPTAYAVIRDSWKGEDMQEFIGCDHCDGVAVTMGVTDTGAVEFLCLECHQDSEIREEIAC